MKKKRKRIAIFLLCVMLLLSYDTVFASKIPEDGIENEVLDENEDRFGTTSPWFSGTQDNSIYENPIDAGEEEQDISVNTPGRVEKYIAELIRNIASALIALLQDTIGASIDSIVYGRVGSGYPNRVNIYAFELRKGNPYGVTASVCYALLRGMMFIFLGVSFVFQLAKAAWSGQTAKSRDEIKSILPILLIKFSTLMLMPYFLDVSLYVRDVLLYGIKSVTGQMMTGGATLSLSKAFLLNAERSGTFVDAAMYLGTVVLTIYFVFLYVSVAIDMLVCFVSFPFICVFHSRKKDLLSGWISTVFSNLMTPVIDAVLLLIPLLTSLMLSDVIRGVAVIQLVMCMLIIPARIRLKALLGIQNNERNGFLGAMAVMTVSRALAARIKQNAGKLADVVSDARKSRMHGELADIDREEEEALLFGDKGIKEKQKASMENGDALHIETGNGTSTEGDLPAAMGNEKIDGVPLEHISDSNSESGEEIHSSDNFAIEKSETEPDADTNTEKNTKGDILRDTDHQMEQAQSALDSLRVERSGLVEKGKQLKRQMLNHKRGSEEYKKLEKEYADAEQQTAGLDEKIAKETGKLNKLRGQSKELHAAFGMRNTPTRFEEKRMEILRKRANINNFEQPEFRGVFSNDEMRKLYRNRAIANSVKVTTGTASAAAGAAIGGASAVFLGGSGSAMAAAGGIRAGSAIGETAVELSINAANVVKPAASRTGKAVYHAADMAASAYLMQKIRPTAMQVSMDIGDMVSAGQETLPDEIQGSIDLEGGKPEIRSQIIADTQNVIAKSISSNGGIKNSSVLYVLQQANLELEREIAVLREEGTEMTDEEIRNRRVCMQKDMLTINLMEQLEHITGYQKGTVTYAEAEKLLREKIEELLMERDKPII